MKGDTLLAEASPLAKLAFLLTTVTGYHFVFQILRILWGRKISSRYHHLHQQSLTVFGLSRWRLHFETTFSVHPFPGCIPSLCESLSCVAHDQPSSTTGDTVVLSGAGLQQSELQVCNSSCCEDGFSNGYAEHLQEQLPSSVTSSNWMLSAFVFLLPSQYLT